MSISGNPTIVVNRPNPNNDVPTSTTSGVQLSVAPVNEFQYVIRFVNMPVTFTRSSSSLAVGNVTLATFPKGLDYILGGTLRITSITADGASLTSANMVISVGTVANTADATLDSTEANIIPSTAAAMTASSVGVLQARTTTVVGLLNGTSTANAIIFNVATSNDITSSRTLTVNGHLLLTATSLGDTAQNV
jgi:hypothetical protein